MLSLEAVQKSFGAVRALCSTTFAFEANKTSVLIGPSGSGKSTLLRLLMGLVTPDAGQVTFQDASVSAEGWLAVRRRMGYVVQEGGLFPHLSAYNNVILMARYLRLPFSDIERRLEELCALVRLNKTTLARKPAELSGGERQRVSLMRALMLDPDVLLLDEPFGALDPMIRSELQMDLREIFRSLQKTTVLVTHDLGEAALLGDTLVLMREGKIVQAGPLSELVEQPADVFVTRFVHAHKQGFEALQGKN